MAVLEIPWEVSRYYRAKYSGVLTTYRDGLHLFKGATLPFDLKPFATQDFSFARWVEDDFQIQQNKSRIGVRKPAVVFTPRDHQKEGAKSIFSSYKNGWSGFLLADSTGVGKTLTTVTGITAIAQKLGYSETKQAKLLIVCPKAAIPNWRQTFVNFPAAHKCMRIMIINYQQLGKLLESTQATKAKTKRGKNRAKARTGTATIDFDFVVFDESQYLKNFPSSAMSMNAVKIAKLDKPYVRGKTPFTVFSTATPGATPLNMAVMAGFISRLIAPSSKDFITPDKWGDFLIRMGFSVSKTKTGYSWATVPWFGKNSDDPKERKKYDMLVKKAQLDQRKDTIRIGKALKTPGAPYLRRSPVDIAGWPKQQIIALPIELTYEKRKLYDEAWSIFKKWLKLPGTAKDSKSRLVEDLRYRQKVSLLKVGPVADFVRDRVNDDCQVYISVEFMDTIDEFKKAFDTMKISYVEVSGRTTDEREANRLKFQRGEAKVVLCTVVEAISFHANETLPDGTKATSNQRITIIHDIRQNPEKAEQALGRAHRDGENSIVYVPFIADTIDDKSVDSYVNKSINMSAMMGVSGEQLTYMERVFAKYGNQF